MKAIKFTLNALLILVFMAGTSYAQGFGQTPVYNRFSLELNAGTLSHYGDVKKYDYWPGEELSFGAGLGLNYHFSPVFTMKGNFLFGKLVGQNTYQNWQFENDFMEYTVNGVINLSQLFSPNSLLNKKFGVYATLGAGMIGYRSILSNLTTDVVMKSVGYEADNVTTDKREWDMVVPFGLGMKFRISERFDLGLESAFRYAATDNLDAVARTFTSHDMYNYTTVGLTIRLGSNTRTPYWAPANEYMYPGDVNRMDGLANRTTEVQENITRLEQTIDGQSYDSDISEMRQQIAALDQKNNELTMRLHNLQGQMGTSAGTTALLSVYFAINSAALNAANYERVAAAARFLQANPEVKMELTGHADHTGPDQFNRILSQRRAQAVHDALVNDFRIDASRLGLAFRGQDAPMSSDKININRRVDFIIVE